MSSVGSLSEGDRFADQKEKVVQILKNRNDFLALHTRDSEDNSPPSGDPGGHWLLNAETMKRWDNSLSAKSFRLVEAKLADLKRVTPRLYTTLYDVFLHPEAGDADYELLQKQAAQGPDHVRGAYKRLLLVESVLDLLTKSLMDDYLYAIFPRRYYQPGGRKSMEEGYREIHRFFTQECGRLRARGRKRVRSAAYDATAEDFGVVRSTIERAVHFVEAGDDVA